MKLDVLAFAAHPDDIELGAGGTLIKLVDRGYKVGIVDMTRGEFGSRGDMATRLRECEEATRILGVHVRENLALPDGRLVNDEDTRLQIARMLRTYQPDLVLTHYPEAPHRDHQVTGAAVRDACYLSGLARLAIDLPRWRPRYVLYHQPPWNRIPTLVVDISAEWERKMQAVRAYRSQFGGAAEDPQPETALSVPAFLERNEARHRFYGALIRRRYGEGFILKDVVPVDDLVALLRAGGEGVSPV